MILKFSKITTNKEGQFLAEVGEIEQAFSAYVQIA